jgi:hypothetical protein
MKLGIYTMAFAFSLLALLLFAASCKQPQTPTTTHVKPLPKGRKVTVSPEKPELLRSEKVGDDTRYVVSYEGQEFHIVAGEKGIFGIKIPAPADTKLWSSLWLDFYPVSPRQRIHKPEELSTQAISYDYVPEEYRSLVQKANNLAGILTEQRPQVGDSAKSPRGARLKLKGLDLQPVAANELSIFRHTNNLLVIVNEPFPMKTLSGEFNETGEMRFREGLSELGYTPDASWARMKMGIRLFDVGLMAIKKSDGGIDCYLEFRKLNDDHHDLVALIKDEGGLLNITRFDPVAPGKEKSIDNEYRMVAGMLLTVLDNQLFDPPAEFKTELTAALMMINQKDAANTFALKKERSGGIEDILYMLGKPQEAAAK